MADLSLAMPAKIVELLKELEQEAEQQAEQEEEPELPMHAVGPQTGQFLYTLVRFSGASRILELGTSWGYSSLWFGAAARYTEGEVHTVERNLDKTEIASKNFSRADLTEVVTIHVGEAIEVLDKLSPPWDIVFLDMSKDQYVPCFEKVAPDVRLGGLVLADNMLTHSERAEIQEFKQAIMDHPHFITQTLEIGKGEEVAIKVGE